MLRKRLYLIILALSAVVLCGSAQKKEQIAILSVNDIHAAIERMPQLAAIADSLRELYPNFLVFSAGDNRTGNPLSDMYSEVSYPMTALMNVTGFDASSAGNHDFDSRVGGLRRELQHSHFPYLVANLIVPDSMNINVRPYKFFDFPSGARVGVVGVVQRDVNGIPETHPDNVKGFKFLPVDETLRNYKWMRDDCNVFIFLTHVGYNDDVKLTQEFQGIPDIIIGGHSHTLVNGGEMHNGILVTQVDSKLHHATLTVVDLEDGKVVSKQAQLIDIDHFSKKNVAAEAVYEAFSNNEAFKRVLTQVSQDLTDGEELGSMMADALRAETGADIALQNYGGVRYDTFAKGPMTVNDVLRLDPFGNEAMMLELTGEEFRQMIIACRYSDECRAPYVSGVKYELVSDKADKKIVKDLTLYQENGKKLDLKRKYKVVCNSYVASVSKFKRTDPGKGLYQVCADLVIQYLEKHPTIDYKGVRRIKETSK
jgi:5'-nucleotidase/UDP-sugar diphosphatase